MVALWVNWCGGRLAAFVRGHWVGEESDGVRVGDGSRMHELENRDAKIWRCGSAFWRSCTGSEFT